MVVHVVAHGRTCVRVFAFAYACLYVLEHLCQLCIVLCGCGE